MNLWQTKQCILKKYLVYCFLHLRIEFKDSLRTVSNILKRKDVYADCSTDPINNKSTVNPMPAKGIFDDCTADPVICVILNFVIQRNP